MAEKSSDKRIAVTGELTKVEARALAPFVNLRRRGVLIAVRLALENAEAVAPAIEVSKRFNIPISTLHGWKKSGRAIAFRLPASRRELLPLAQFSNTEVAPWAGRIIAVLGNGLPAFHFLMVSRRSLGGASYSQRILGGCRSATALIELGLRLLEIE